MTEEEMKKFAEISPEIQKELFDVMIKHDMDAPEALTYAQSMMVKIILNASVDPVGMAKIIANDLVENIKLNVNRAKDKEI